MNTYYKVVVRDYDLGYITYCQHRIRQKQKMKRNIATEAIQFYRMLDLLSLLLHQADRGRGSGVRIGGGVAWQYGHRGRRRARPMVRRRRMVGMEAGAWRSGRSGGRAESATTRKVYVVARPPAGPRV